MKFEIKHRYTHEILFSCEGESWGFAVELAIKSKIDLRSANLSYANLSYANLRSADLSYADLSCANLSYADLRSANLSSANLRSANLSSANLSSANLSSANLRFANLSSANLRFANLMTFQFQQHQAFYTFDGGLRIGCILMPVTEWALGFEEIGRANSYTEEQIILYGQFINMCLEHFKRNNKELIVSDYCQCGGWLGSGGVDSYGGRYCRCANPKIITGKSFSSDKIVLGMYVSQNEINNLQSQNTELKALVRELVEVCEWAANIDKPCYKTKCTCVEDGCQIVLSKNKELIEAIRSER